MTTLKTTCKCSEGKKFTNEIVSLIDENGFFTDTNLPFLKCAYTFYDNIYINPAFYIFSTFLLVGIIDILIYFIRKKTPIDVYTNELDYQIIEFITHKENEKNKKKEMVNKNEEENKKELAEKEMGIKKSREIFAAQYEKSDD